MDRRAFLGVAGTTAVPFAGCLTDGGRDEASLVNAGFEAGLDGWTVGRDLPTDPNTGDPVASAAEVTDDRASDGAHALSLALDGSQDDGTIWVQQPVDLGAAESLAVDVYSQSESFNTLTKVAAYAGPRPENPLTEERFDTSRPVEDHAGWRTYEYAVDHDGPGLVAVGITVVWETNVTRFLDAVRLSQG